nr:MAG TPA: hypothetical protein [Caudoviricetes sp.]
MSHTTKSRYVHLEIALPIDLAHILACYKDIIEENTDQREGIGYLIGYWVNTQQNSPYDPEDDSCTLCRHALEHEVEHPNDQLTAALAKRALATTSEDAKACNAAILQELINTASAIVGDD